MKNLSLIVAIGKNGEIGKDNKLLCHIPEDLHFFKEKTMNKKIIMGSKTFYSLPNLLPNRHHIVLTKSNNQFPNEVEVFNNFDSLLNYIKNIDDEIVIIGGAMIYELFISYVNKMYITEIDKQFDADTFFPEIDYSNWDRKVLSKHIYENVKYNHVEYTRKGD